MIKDIIVGICLFVVAVLMTMVGKGGGNFYVVILTIIGGIPMYEAATTGQFILFTASLAAMIIFQKNKSLSWHLAFFIGVLASISAMGGGYFSHLFSGFTLKIIFSVMLFLAGAIMLIPVSDKKRKLKGGQTLFKFRYGDDVIEINVWIAVPVTVLTGFASGMVGVSGGSFLVPLMVLACGAPMHLAVGTASTLIAATSFMGFLGHALQGDFNPKLAVPLAIITIVGGLIGSKFALKTKPKSLKRLFAYTNWVAAIFMLVNALSTKGIIK